MAKLKALRSCKHSTVSSTTRCISAAPRAVQMQKPITSSACSFNCHSLHSSAHPYDLPAAVTFSSSSGACVALPHTFGPPTGSIASTEPHVRNIWRRAAAAAAASKLVSHCRHREIDSSNPHSILRNGLGSAHTLVHLPTLPITAQQSRNCTQYVLPVFQPNITHRRSPLPCSACPGTAPPAQPGLPSCPQSHASRLQGCGRCQMR